MLLRATSTVVTFLAKRKAPHRAAFNAAAATLGLAAGGVVLFALGVHRSPVQPWHPSGQDIWRILLAGAACFLVTLLLITVAIALHAREPVLRTLMKTLPYEVIVSVVLYATAPLVALAISAARRCSSCFSRSRSALSTSTRPSRCSVSTRRTTTSSPGCRTASC